METQKAKGIFIKTKFLKENEILKVAEYAASIDQDGEYLGQEKTGSWFQESHFEPCLREFSSIHVEPLGVSKYEVSALSDRDGKMYTWICEVVQNEKK